MGFKMSVIYYLISQVLPQKPTIPSMRNNQHFSLEYFLRTEKWTERMFTKSAIYVEKLLNYNSNEDENVDYF